MTSKPSGRKKLESALLAVLADYIPIWTKQHEALGRIMTIIFPGADPGAHAEMVSALAEVMQLDIVLNRGRLDKLASLMLGQHYTADQIREVYRLSPDTEWGKDWRSERGTKPPSERGLRDTVAMLTRKVETDRVVDLDANS